MKRILQALALLGLAAWTALALFLWRENGARAEMAGAAGREASEKLALLTDDVANLHRDLRGLTDSLNEGLGALADGIGSEMGTGFDGESDRLDALQAAIQELQGRLDEREEGVPDEVLARLAGIEAKLADLADAGRALREAGISEPAVEQPEPPLPEVVEEPLIEEPVVETEPEASPASTVVETPSPPAEEKTHRSFLAFRLPSDDFQRDELRTWSVIGELSRVGFDGSSTLHDFSGASTRVQGTFEANPGHPATGFSGSISFPAKSLGTGLEGRDEELFDVLDVESYPEVRLDLMGFAPDPDASGLDPIRGTVHGRMTIRGVSRDFAAPVEVRLDEAHRMQIEGEAPLLLTDYEIPVPNKAGIIKMDPKVRIWFSLRARVRPRGRS